jgi:hypothetical protein
MAGVEAAAASRVMYLVDLSSMSGFRFFIVVFLFFTLSYLVIPACPLRCLAGGF